MYNQDHFKVRARGHEYEAPEWQDAEEVQGGNAESWEGDLFLVVHSKPLSMHY